MPRELLLSLPVLTATGRQEIRLENYRGIQEYTQELIRVNTRSGQIRLTGKAAGHRVLHEHRDEGHRADQQY